MMNRSKFGAMAVAGLLGSAAMAFAPSEAEACGGFFCDNQQPINQAAERIVFSSFEDDEGNDKVTAIVQILYEGPSESFAWLLPVPSVPDISVSSNLAFQRLQAATNPNYTLNTEVEGECKEAELRSESVGADFDDANNQNAEPSADGGGVSVLDSGVVGPYDFTVITVDDTLPDPTQSALDWLDDNSYDVTATGPEVIRPYIEEGMFLVAFKLTKNAMSGDIRPVILTYDMDVPSIPIKLTAVAANDDMGVMTWVLGDSRAVPVVYKSLILNDALINWFNPASTYNDVISRAADEADGQGFVTEFAGSTEIAEKLVFTESDQSQWEYFEQTDWTGNETNLVTEAWQTYAGDFAGAWDGWQETINGFFSGLSQEDRDLIIDCAPCSEGVIPTTFDPQVFIDQLEENIIEPMKETQEVLDAQPYMTRLFTTMSAAEMTVDPVFDYNSDLPDVSNSKTATRTIECSPDVFQSEAPWRAELPSGAVVRGQGNAWPLSANDDIPANSLVLQDSTSGDGEIIEDNTETIQQALGERNVDFPSPPGFSGEANIGMNGGDKSDASACATVGASALPIGLVLALFGLFGVRRRHGRR